MTSKTISVHGSNVLIFIPDLTSKFQTFPSVWGTSLWTVWLLLSISFLQRGLWHLLLSTHSSPTHLFSTLLIAKGLHLSPPLPSQSPGNNPQLDLFSLLPLHQKGFQGSFVRNVPRTGLSVPVALLPPSIMESTSFHIRSSHPVSPCISPRGLWTTYARSHAVLLSFLLWLEINTCCKLCPWGEDLS